MPGKHIILLGPPGSGKGTQAVRIAEAMDLAHLSTGDLLRDAISNKTELGVKAADFVEKGLLVPDEIVLGLVREKLAGLGDSGWILDGFPRTIDQAKALMIMIERQGITIDHIIFIDVDSEVIVERLSNRRVCPECKAVFATGQGGGNGKCSNCGVDLVKRVDDEEETVRRRLEVYREQTAPVVEFCKRMDILVTIDGERGIEEIAGDVLEAVR